MDKAGLKPIGTTYEVKCPPKQDSTDLRSSIHTRKIVRHSEYARFTGDTIGGVAEEYKTIKIEYEDLESIERISYDWH